MARDTSTSLLVADVASDDGTDSEPEDSAINVFKKLHFADMMASEVRMIRHDFHPTPYRSKFFKRPIVIIFMLTYVIGGICLPIFFMFQAHNDLIATLDSDLNAVDSKDQGNMTDLARHSRMSAASNATGTSFFVEDPVEMRLAISRLCLIPVSMMAVLVVFPNMIQVSVWPFVIMFVMGLRSCFSNLVHERYHHFMTHVMDHLTVTLVLVLYLMLLDYLDHIVHDLVRAEQHLLEEKQVKKMRGILHAVTHTGNEHKDKFNTTKSIHSIAEVMYVKVWHVIYQTSRIVALLVFFAFNNRGSGDGGPILAAGALYVSFMGLLAGFKFWDKASLVLNIWTHKPFFVGDLVTVGSVSGFVEHLTLSYIVIRTFGMKQAWVPLTTLEKDIIQNWTRRPFKPINLSFSIKGKFTATSLEKLVQFGNEWVDQHKDVQQKGYKKFELAGCEDGATILVIFFPNIGVDKGDLRQEFVIAFMEASSRLGLSMSPNCIVVQSDPSMPHPNPDFASLLPRDKNKRV